MNSRIVSLLALALLALPASSQEKADPAAAAVSLEQPVHAPGLEIRIVVTDAERQLTSSSIFGDLVDDGYRMTCSGSTILVPTPASQWVADAELRIWDPEVIKNSAKEVQTRSSTFTVKIKQPRKNPGIAGETGTVEPVTIYSTVRAYKGPGTYELFSTGNLKVSASFIFAEAVEVEKK